MTRSSSVDLSIYNLLELKRLTHLLADVSLNSRAIATERNNAGVKVVVKTASGLKLILAKKLVISIPPLLSNLAGFDLSITERTLFSQFQNVADYTSLVRNTGIPDDITITNVGAGTPYNLPTCKSPLPSSAKLSMMLIREQCQASTESTPPASPASNPSSLVLHRFSPRTLPSKPPSSLKSPKSKRQEQSPRSPTRCLLLSTTIARMSFVSRRQR